jgi:hypothetical protein
MSPNGVLWTAVDRDRLSGALLAIARVLECNRIPLRGMMLLHCT